jgi:hypothetical protein
MVCTFYFICTWKPISVNQIDPNLINNRHALALASQDP